uniref:RALF-like protein n=1 Tax=Solanum tuberosum TaxID=4113 RepID=M1AMD2_SOLTU
MASTSGNKNINVIIVLCFILLIAFSSSAEDVSDSKKHIKFPPNHSTSGEKSQNPHKHYHRGCSALTRCRKDVDSQP